MSYENNPGHGGLFKHESANPKAPVSKGNIKTLDHECPGCGVMVAGRDLQISAWRKDGTKGAFLSLKLEEPYQKNEAGPRADPAPPQAAPNDDEIIPF